MDTNMYYLIYLRKYIDQSYMYYFKLWKEKFEDTKTGDWRKNRLYNGLKKKDKQLYLHCITQKTKDRAIRIPLKPGINSCAPEEWAVPSLHVTPVVLVLVE